MIKLKPITKDDHLFLYELLVKRDAVINISHRKVPTYNQHVKFVTSKPYSKWYIVFDGSKKIGSAYLSKQDEIGIHINDNSNDKMRGEVLKLLIQKNPRKRYLANVNPRNKKIIRFLEKKRFRLIQYTYELSTNNF